MHVKSGMVRPPDTIIDPGAVMVISLHTPVADVAVSTLWQSDNLAERTECLRVECFHERVELYLPVRLDVARI